MAVAVSAPHDGGTDTDEHASAPRNSWIPAATRQSRICSSRDEHEVALGPTLTSVELNEMYQVPFSLEHLHVDGGYRVRGREGPAWPTGSPSNGLRDPAAVVEHQDEQDEHRCSSELFESPSPLSASVAQKG